MAPPPDPAIPTAPSPSDAFPMPPNDPTRTSKDSTERKPHSASSRTDETPAEAPMEAPPPKAPFTFPPELPISAKVRDIAEAIQDHPVVIVAGATGSGKTTQLPKICLALGRGIHALIGVTQPRRIAATSVAARVASEIGSPLGTDVGYQIRFEDRTSPQTYVKFMTDGILLAEIQGDPLLRKYDTLIIDEAHERSLTIDFLLGWIHRILPERPDLKVIVSSATLETERFSEFFRGAPVVQVEGRTFPVEVLYEPPSEEADLAEAVASAVENVCSLDSRGDILVFLPGEREIREAENELSQRKLRHTTLLPLYARLSASEQARVFEDTPQRRVILATNVAETSLTLPRIVYVVDTGLARLSRYEPRSGTTRLQIEAISQASADQRKGRCGRVREGICVRLYDEDSFRARAPYTDPEIKRTGLAGVILRMKALGLGQVETFPFLDPPHAKAISEGYRVLEELGALDEHRNLTPLGTRLARFPVDPRIGRMILAGLDLGCVGPVLIVAAGLNVQDPRERPRDAQQKADDLHRRFRDETSDFVGLLRLWEAFQEAESRGKGHLRRWCKENFLSYIRLREWKEIHRQLVETLEEMRLVPNVPKGDRSATTGHVKAKGGPDVTEGLHRAILTGILSKIGYYHPEQRTYVGAKQTRFTLHPSSALSKRPPAWVMAFELVETTQLFARTAARLDPAWLESAGHHLLKRTYSEPHWSEKSARASIREHATLFGLPVLKDRSVDYALVSPRGARRMFIEHALVRGEYQSRGSFQQRNRTLLAEVARLRDKARKSDMLADEDALVAFFEQRVPDEVVNGKTFEAFRESAERENPNALTLTLEDVLAQDPDLKPEDYPDTWTIHGVDVPITYCFDPASDRDGITLTLPLVLVPQIDPEELGWTIPGWHREKLLALLYEVPKAHRRELGPLPDLADELARTTRPFEGPLRTVLQKAIEEAKGTRLPYEALRPDGVSPYLRVFCRIVDADGKLLAEGRDIEDLWDRLGARARAVWSASAPSATFERKGLVAWSFDALPESITRSVAGTEVRSYPALVDTGTAVDLVLLETQAAAEAATRTGLRRLLLLTFKGLISSHSSALPGPFPRWDGGFASRADQDAFRQSFLARVTDDAFQLEAPNPLPRSKRDFEALASTGMPRWAPAFKRLADALRATQGELEKVNKLLRNAAKHPSGKNAFDDVTLRQLPHLFPPNALAVVGTPRWAHYPRYLRGIQIRLERALSDPRKDADKAAPLAPLWAQYIAKRDSARDREAVEDLRWSIEELRVTLFAPELRTPAPVSAAKVASALSALR